MKNILSKIVVRMGLVLVAVILLILHGLSLFLVDASSVALLIFIAVLLFLPYIKSIELPGGGKVTFKDTVNEIYRLSISTFPGSSINTVRRDSWDNKLLFLATEDPNLALAGLRMRLEEKLRALAVKIKIRGAERISLRKLLREVQGVDVLIPGQVYYLFDSLIDATNKAVHGQKVEHDDAIRLLDTGATLIQFLEQEITKAGDISAAENINAKKFEANG